MKDRIKYLLEQFEKGELKTEETDSLLELTGDEGDAVREGILEMMEQEADGEELIREAQWEVVLKRIVSVDRPVPVRRIKSYAALYWAAAAMVFISLSIAFYFYAPVTGQGIGRSAPRYAVSIPPGGNKAVLTLADGSEISLSDAENGELAKQSGINIIKTAEGQLTYDVSASNKASEGHNKIATPRGGQYQINLPDGTKVWLNAASSLKFPLTFTGLKNRIVELSGEAYFEVTKNKHQPFKVLTAAKSDQGGRAQVIEVLGTHFNVNSYADEESTKTTLLEGSIRLNNELTLKPGEQSIFVNDHFHVIPVDMEEMIAWKKGYFMFANEDIRSIMRKISRWYDLEIVYQGKPTDNTFIGTVSRFKEVSEVLNILELTKTVHFKIEGRRITVMP
ncbi:FecR family protein [Pedobacter caeni]|uniref:FecR family protein n=1 Tax=Pedobacter caeni TaxID=288992 RepID=A0A1M5HBG6_9SPHI|nr:FecR family protein [Pedobacter caeni]SHG13251.1 FecR family protein [Pedobacter caeni]